MDNHSNIASQAGLTFKRFYPASKPSRKIPPLKKALRKRFFFRNLTHIGYEQSQEIQIQTASTPREAGYVWSENKADIVQTTQLNTGTFIDDIAPKTETLRTKTVLTIKDVPEPEYTPELLPGENPLDNNKKASADIQNTPRTRKRSGLASLFSFGTVKEFFKFGLVSATTFVLVLVSMNFSAYYQIGNYWLSQWSGEQNIQTRNIENYVALDKQKAELLSVNQIGQVPFLPKAGSTGLALNLDVLPPNNYIFIPKIGKNAPIVEVSDQNLIAQKWGDLEKDIQGALKDGVVHYPGTATPGQPGNFFITGHSSYYFWEHSKYKDIFALLDQLEVGDRYVIYYNQKKYVYEVIEKKIVPPSDTSVLRPEGNDEISTLMTCHPVGTDLNRLIIRAKRV